MEDTRTSSSPDGHSDDATGRAAETAARLGDRVKTRVAEVVAQLQSAEAIARQKLAPVPGVLRGTLNSALEKVRDGLDLATRQEVSSLTARLDDLDRKLEQVSAGGTPKPKASGTPGEWS